MNYFVQLSKENGRISLLAEQFLSDYEFVPNDILATEIHIKAWAIFKEHGENWETIPEWVADVVDWAVPYTTPSNNGSIGYLLGYSSASNDAHLRAYYENVINGSDIDLDFPVVAEILNIN